MTIEPFVKIHYGKHSNKVTGHMFRGMMFGKPRFYIIIDREHIREQGNVHEERVINSLIVDVDIP